MIAKSLLKVAQEVRPRYSQTRAREPGAAVMRSARMLSKFPSPPYNSAICCQARAVLVLRRKRVDPRREAISHLSGKRVSSVADAPAPRTKTLIPAFSIGRGDGFKPARAARS